MKEFMLSKKPLQDNPICASCGKVFHEKGLTLRFDIDHKIIDFPLCQLCFELFPLVKATVNPETGFARMKR